MARAYWFDNNQTMRTRRGMGDSGYLPRGSKIQWSGVVQGIFWTTEGIQYLGLSPGRQGLLESKLRAQGFGLSSDSVDFTFDSMGWDKPYYRIIVSVTTPIDYSSADHAFSVINQDVWDVYGMQPERVSTDVLNRVVIDPKTGQSSYAGAPANIRPPGDAGACSQKSGFDWLACQFDLDTTAQKLGLGVGAGVTLVAVGLAVVAIIILKK